MTNIEEKIIESLPYGPSFLFVDSIYELSEKGIKGRYRFREDEYFYESHFTDNPVTPGVILVECMAQIGLVCFGMFLRHNAAGDIRLGTLAFTSSEVNFYKTVFPGEEVEIVASKEYWRMGKLKTNVKVFDNQGKVVCEGTLSGMIK